MTWTLVQSFQYSETKKGGHNFPLFQNKPKNEDSPSWKQYRLSKSRMKHIQQDLNHKWRLTCNFDSDGPVYTDYVQASHAVVPLLSTDGQHDDCQTVEFINIRGQAHTNGNVRIVHEKRKGLHIDSYHSGIKCMTKFLESKKCDDGSGEDNFGEYRCTNKNHRCSSSETSTTQLWFGGQ